MKHALPSSQNIRSPAHSCLMRAVWDGHEFHHLTTPLRPPTVLVLTFVMLGAVQHLISLLQLGPSPLMSFFFLWHVSHSGRGLLVSSPYYPHLEPDARG